MGSGAWWAVTGKGEERQFAGRGSESSIVAHGYGNNTSVRLVFDFGGKTYFLSSFDFPSISLSI